MGVIHLTVWTVVHACVCVFTSGDFEGKSPLQGSLYFLGACHTLRVGMPECVCKHSVGGGGCVSVGVNERVLFRLHSWVWTDTQVHTQTREWPRLPRQTERTRNKPKRLEQGQSGPGKAGTNRGGLNWPSKGRNGPKRAGGSRKGNTK